MDANLIGRDTQQFIQTFQDVHRILLELCHARWDVLFPVLLEQAAKEYSVVAALASELADLNSLRRRCVNIFGGRSAIPGSAELAKLEQIQVSLRRALRQATADRPGTDRPHSQGTVPQEPAIRRISGIDAAVQVLTNRDSKEVSIGELTAAAMKAGWSPKGKTPQQTLSAALSKETKRRGSFARFAKGSRPGSWRLSTAGIHYANGQVYRALVITEPDFGMRMALLLKAHDCSVAAENGVEL